MRSSVGSTPLSLTATFLRRYRFSKPLSSTLFPSSPFSSSSSAPRSSADASAKDSTGSELTRLATVVEGCDYEHWLVVTEPPKGYRLRDEIISGYIQTLATALGSEEEAKKSIYSVSTKYYFAFGCKVPEDLTSKIKSLPNVRWVLPDSYLCHGENDYGGEPLVEGVAVQYDEKYHADWVRDEKYKA
ncbi:hypothetical protein TB1_024097 [Malus domestica]